MLVFLSADQDSCKPPEPEYEGNAPEEDVGPDLGEKKARMKRPA